jgi:hypothetical protein
MIVAAPNGLRRACRLCAFAIAPGNFFDGDNAAAATVDPPHGVQKEDEKPPQENELKVSFGELFVTGPGKWQREQTAAEPLRGRTATSILFLSALKWACW